MKQPNRQKHREKRRTDTSTGQRKQKTMREFDTLRAGYVQHTSPHQNPPVLNGILTQFIMYCQTQTMAEATIRTKYKILKI